VVSVNKLATFILCCVALSGCAGVVGTGLTAATDAAPPPGQQNATPEPSPAVPEITIPEGAQTILALTIADLASREGVPAESIQVLSVQAVTWPDASLGCPQSGIVYAQVETPGLQIQLEIIESIYWYHTDLGDQLMLCRNGKPLLPPIPIQPGEKIQDGIPWMPVEPPSTKAP
jgi:hypothetical protein